MDEAPTPTGAELPEELLITLRKPVTIGELSITEIRLQEPTASQMLQWDRLSGTEADIVAVSIVSGIPKPAVEKIGARDLLKGARYIAAFLSDAPSTGASA